MPIEFSEDIALRVCGHIAEGLSLRQIEKLPGMPSKSGVMKWLFEGEAYKAHGQGTHPKALFVDQYAHAKEFQAESLAEECLDIADDNHSDMFKDEDGREVVNYDHINRARLKIDTRKWLAGKLRPKKYGDKIQTENKTEVSGGLTVERVFYGDRKDEDA